MTALFNSFEGITPSGTTISTGNSGGISGNAFDAVTIGSGAACASDATHTAHGALSAKISSGTTSASSFVSWTTSMGTQTEVWFRGFYYFTANPAANISIWRAFNGGSLAAGVNLLTTGALRWVDAGSSTILTTTATVPLNQWWRVEGFVITSATVGQVEIKLFKTQDSPTPDETDTSAASFNTGAQATAYRYGLTGNTASVGPFWLDDIGLSNQGYLGPGFIALPATVTTTGALANDPAKTLTATVTTSGAVARTVSRTLTATVTAAGALARTVARALPVTAATSGSVARQVARQYPAAVTTTASAGKTLSRTLTVTVTATAALARAVARTFAASPVTTAGNVLRGTVKALRVTVSAVASLVTSAPPHILPGVVTIAPAGPCAALATVTAPVTGNPSPASPGPGRASTPGVAVPGWFTPGHPALLPSSAAHPASAVTVTPAGAAGAQVTVTQA